MLYSKWASAAGRPICLDKTPAYALVLPFLEKVYPDAKYLILTRHPAAIFSSYANSFFDGDYRLAEEHNPILRRYVPAIASYLRETQTSHLHVKYEELVASPASQTKRICDFLDIQYEPKMIEYGGGGKKSEGLGDPTGVEQHARPTTESVTKWAYELANDAQKLSRMRRMIEQLPEKDLRTWEYPLETIWKPLEEADGKVASPPRAKWTLYRAQRKTIILLRGWARKSRIFRHLLSRLRLACDVLLRER